MANVFGNSEQKSVKHELIPLVILLAIPFVVVSMLFEPTGDTMTQLATVGSVGAALTLLLVFVYARINPRSLQRLFQPAEYQRSLALDCSVGEHLARLDDGHYVFNSFIFELCGVEHMVISPGGIFVIGKVNRQGELRVHNDILFAGDRPLETLTGNTWRICHLVNIVLKKWFKIDYMPHPVLVAGYANPSDLCQYDGMPIIAPGELCGVIRDRTQEINPEVALGFAKFLRERYVPNK